MTATYYRLSLPESPERRPIVFESDDPAFHLEHQSDATTVWGLDGTPEADTAFIVRREDLQPIEPHLVEILAGSFGEPGVALPMAA